MVVLFEVVECVCGVMMVDCLWCDFDFMCLMFVCGDVIEGVCVLIVDKDYQLVWCFKLVVDVDCVDVFVMFDSLWMFDMYLLCKLQD